MAGAPGYQRILVHLQKEGCVPRLAQFTECILSSLNINNNAGLVRCELRDGMLALSC